MAKILLVEDEVNIASFIERGLKEFGHTVSVANDGNSGWELIRQEVFDLLIIDIIMPGMNGLELCRLYRRQYGYLVPVIMLTALGTTEDIVKGLDAGADDYLRSLSAFRNWKPGSRPSCVEEEKIPPGSWYVMIWCLTVTAAVPDVEKWR